MASTCRIFGSPCINQLSRKLLKRKYVLSCNALHRNYSENSGSSTTDSSADNISDNSNITQPSTLTAFAKFVEDTSKSKDIEPSKDRKAPTKFASMFRRSKFVQLGNPENRILEGMVVDVVNNDLYIDYGGKFHCVCPKPAEVAVHGQIQVSEYKPGTKVKLILKDFEMSSAFLGSEKHVTLLESDAVLIGLLNSKTEENTKQEKEQSSQGTETATTSV